MSADYRDWPGEPEELPPPWERPGFADDPGPGLEPQADSDPPPPANPANLRTQEFIGPDYEPDYEADFQPGCGSHLQDSGSPLFRALPECEPFPVDALGEVLGGAVKAIADVVHVPPATAAGSVLAAASLAVQGLADVELPIAGGTPRPSSLFVLTVAASGERKSSSDKIALRAVADFEAAMGEAYRRDLPAALAAREAWTAARDKAKRGGKGLDWRAARDAVTALGPEPLLPVAPILTAPEPTLQGLARLFPTARPSLGLMSDEGGGMIGGWGFQQEQRVATMAALNGLWDGSPIKRVRAGDGAEVMHGRRLALHLMLQPTIAPKLLADPEAAGIGLLARFLVAQPPELAGTRFQRVERLDSSPALATYQRRLGAILGLKLPTAADDPRHLQPRRLGFTPDGRAAWRAYANTCERRIGQDGDWREIRPWASKAAEHAARLAAVVALFHDPEIAELDAEAFNQGARLADFYGGEMLRLCGAAAIGVELIEAEQLRHWIVYKGKVLVAASEVMNGGPNLLRTAPKARAALQRLEEVGWLVKLPNGSEIDGRRRRDVWRVSD
jgi:hypothetical protein